MGFITLYVGACFHWINQSFVVEDQVYYTVWASQNLIKELWTPGTYLISFNRDTDSDEDATSKTNMAGTFNDCEMFLELHILEQKL